jgi:cyclophilin family peptidyl-prolyl cis-trans isomerase
MVHFHTSVGGFDVELFDADKPLTVSNFLHYVDTGRYTNMFMHRVVTNFVIQGGGFYVTDRGTKNVAQAPIPTFDAVSNEFNAGRFYSNVYGTIAMAKTSDPDSATSQFFFNLADNSAALDNPANSGGFTVFGHVTAGTDTLDRFKIGPTNRAVKISHQGGTFDELPVRYAAKTTPTFDDLIYVDISYPPTYPVLPGTYRGFFSPPAAAAQSGPGFVTLTTTAAGKFSGSMLLGSARYSLSGTIDADGYARSKAANGKFGSVVLALHTDSGSAGEQLVGTVSTDGWVVDAAVQRAAPGAQGYSGNYTMVIPGSNQPGLPAGHGFASVTVDPAGKVKVTGALADGTAFTQSAVVSADGRWPLYVPLYGGNGSLSGWVTFLSRPAETNRPADDLNASLLWVKPAIPVAKYFAAGFTMQIDATGAHYTPPPTGSRVLNLADGRMTFSDGDLAEPFTTTFTLSPANKFTSTGSNSLVLNLALPTGLFTGTVKAPGAARATAFKGALLQNQNGGEGYFLGTDRSGAVVLGP